MEVKWMWRAFWLSWCYTAPMLCFRTYTKEDVLLLREEVREMFQHAYEGYLKYAGNYDELRPLSCDGVDTWGSYSLTLIDALDTLAVMGNYTEFRRVVDILTEKTTFDADINVSVFETNIRIVGGLLGAHLMSLRAGIEVEPGWPCNGPLLRLAEDVAKRLLPAFDTRTGMPYGTVNLRHGVPAGETPVTCTAGVGTFIVEFGALSRLTGDPIYEEVALNALYALWRHRSPIGLFGNHIDVQTGRWTAQDAGIGAGVDSYYEYLVKGALMLNRPELLEMFHTGRKAIDKYLKRDDWHVWVSMNKGQVTLPVFQSLEAYWPGVLSLIGDIAPAMKTLHNYHSVWKQYGFLPEFYNIPSAEAGANRENYPLRPELIESVMYLYRATSDPYLLEVGEDMLRSIQYSAKTTCGYATIKNVRDHRKEDRMESFFLAETTKYLYLLFDPDNFLHNDGREGTLHETPNGVCVIDAGGYIFNTEAHPIDPSALRCCHDSSDWFKDFKVEKFLGEELKRKEVKDAAGCPNERVAPSSDSNFTIEIEANVSTDETRQKMIAEIMEILKKMENEPTTSGKVKQNEDAADSSKMQFEISQDDADKWVLQAALATEKTLEFIVNGIRSQQLIKVHEKMVNMEVEATQLMADYEILLTENLKVNNKTAEDIKNEEDSDYIENVANANRASLKHMVANYQKMAYNLFLLNVFKSLHTLQKLHLKGSPENIAKTTVDVLFSLKSGTSEAFLSNRYPDILEIFASTQQNYELLLAKKNFSLNFYVYAKQLQDYNPSMEDHIGKIMAIIQISNEKKKQFEKLSQQMTRGPINLQLFDNIYEALTHTREFNASVPTLIREGDGETNRQPNPISKESVKNDDIILLDPPDRSAAQKDQNLAIDYDSEKNESGTVDEHSEARKDIDEELNIGTGSVEEISLGTLKEAPATPAPEAIHQPAVEDASAKNRMEATPPSTIQGCNDDTSNNSLLTDFVHTILKSTLPTKPKFEAQLLLERIRAEGIYNSQPQNFELLTCRAQPFLQRVSINGDFMVYA